MKKKKKNKGIVLLEAIIAVSVLALIFSSALELFSNAVRATRTSLDTTVASHLAEDAAEFLVARRLFNIDGGSEEWTDGITCEGECGIDTTVSAVADASLTPCSDPSNCVLKKTAGENWKINHDTSGVATPYTRKISTALSYDGNELTATIVVSWSAGNHTESYTLVQRLYKPKDPITTP
jgi:Tfp pilus assembly protein PilV